MLIKEAAITEAIGILDSTGLLEGKYQEVATQDDAKEAAEDHEVFAPED